MNRFLWIAVGALAVSAGCAKTDEGKTVNESTVQIEQRQREEVDRLKTVDHLPPQARAASVQMMQQQQANARAAATAFARK